MTRLLFRNSAGQLAACLLLFSALPLMAVPQNFCKVCHSEVEVKFRESAHYQEDLACTSCHGGDPSVSEMDPAHSKDFRGAPSRQEIPAFCAECHSDPERMRSYGIPFDQHALYLTSGHGRKFVEGDTQVAICTDCHGSHRILAKDHPENPTHHQQISATCGHCHTDAEMMAPYALPTDIIDQYEASVHAEALHQRGDPQAPECTRCHGSHGAAPPGVGNVSKVCGQCHTLTRDAFRLSPHQDIMATSGQGDCAACHGNHRVLSPGSELWTSACISCHDAGSEAIRTGEKIQAVFTQAKEDVEKASLAIVQAREIPLDVTDYEARLSIAATYLVEARPLSHSLDVADIEEITRKSRAIAREVQGEIHEKILVFGGRKFIVIFVWLYILITIVAIQYYKRSVR